jgi:hypothetical protein
MKVKLTIWRQKNPAEKGKFVSYPVDVENGEMSMLELLDVLNETLSERGEEPVAFEHDCREGICGSCGFMINGVAHGPMPATTVCQLTMRHFKDGDELVLEPRRSRSSRISSSIAAPSIASFSPEATSPFLPATRPTGMPFRLERKLPIERWMPLPASDAAHASLPARMAPRRCSPVRRSLTSAFFPRANRKRIVAPSAWWRR